MTHKCGNFEEEENEIVLHKSILSIFGRLLPFLLVGLMAMPITLPAQDEGGEKEKKEKKEKPPKEKKVKKEKPPKEKKSKKSGEEDEEDEDEDDGEEEEQGGGEESGNEAGENPAPEAAKKPEPKYDDPDSNKVEVPCARYRSGYMAFIDKNYHGIKIQRKGKKEIHYNTNDGNKLVFKIEWLQDCEYRLKFVKGKMPSRFRKGYIMTCKITKCYSDYYDCDCDLNGIIQYGSVHKEKTKSEILAEERAELEKLKKQEEAARKASEDSLAKANAAANPEGNATPPANPEDEKKVKGEKKAKPEKGAKKPKKEKAPKEKKAKKEKPPKEKKEKAPKEKAEKPPKEKKEKEPEEE